LSEVLTAKLATLREEDALSYGFSAGYAPRVAGGLWRLSGKVPVARAAEAARLIERTLDAMRASLDAYRAEFVHARRTLVEALAGSAADSSAVLDRLVLIERFGLAPGYFDQLLSEIARLRIDEMHAFLTTELASGRQVFGAFGPRAAAAAALAAAREEQSRMSPARAP
jgi:predicted Zn-dependent peptidase